MNNDLQNLTTEPDYKWFKLDNTLFYPDDGILIFEIKTTSLREKLIRQRIKEMSEEMHYEN